MNKRVDPNTELDPVTLWETDKPAFHQMLANGLLNDTDRLPAALFIKATPPCFFWEKMSIEDGAKFDQSVTEFEWVTREMVESGQVMVCDDDNDSVGKGPLLRQLAHALGWLELRTTNIHPHHWLMKHRVSMDDDAEETTVDFVSRGSHTFSDGDGDFDVHVTDSVTVSWRQYQHCFQGEAALSWFDTDDCFMDTLVVVGEPSPYEVARIIGSFYDEDGAPSEYIWAEVGEQLGQLIKSLNGATAAESIQSVVTGAGVTLLPNTEGSLTLVSIKDKKVQAFDASALYEIADLLRQDGDHSAAIVAALRPLVEAFPA